MEESSAFSFHAFQDPILASVIRIQMERFSSAVCMKVELYGCSQTAQGMFISVSAHKLGFLVLISTRMVSSRHL